MTDLRLSRRDLLRLGVAAGPASLAAACGWTGGPPPEPKLRAVSRLNDWGGEKLFLSSTRLAPQFPGARRTAPRDFPAYALTPPLPVGAAPSARAPQGK